MEKYDVILSTHLIDTGRKLQVIKHVRNATQAALMDAKDAVDNRHTADMLAREGKIRLVLDGEQVGYLMRYLDSTDQFERLHLVSIKPYTSVPQPFELAGSRRGDL